MGAESPSPVAHVTAIPVGDLDFSPFGRHITLARGAEGVVSAEGNGWRDLATVHPLLEQPAQLGMTVGGIAPFIVRRMERHLCTEEAILCAEGPLVLAVVAPTDAPRPSSSDVTAVRLAPGDVVVLRAGTWHDACRGVRGEEARYYWLATEVPGDANWVELNGGAVEVSC